MQLNFDKINFVIGDKDIIDNMTRIPSLQIFDSLVIQYLDSVSKILLADPEAKQYPDVITFGFWCRKSSLFSLKKQYESEQNRLGKGIVFHIAPSNVAVNFAYSFVTGLLSGNANIVRLPSKDFEQVKILSNAFLKVLSSEIKDYICFVKYGHDQEITDYLSAICDMRVIWGGDQTITAIRKSPLKPRANEITFADRFSICIIDSDQYINADNKKNIAMGFYNDTYLSDQNACTSPRIIIWLGQNIKSAQQIFWSELYTIVEDRYELQPVKSVSKYTNLCKLAALNNNFHVVNYNNNSIIRVKVDSLNDDIMDYRGNCGFFFEYYAKDISEINPLCTSQCQTLAYYGVDKDIIKNYLMTAKPRGIDRYVPIGKTMDFSLVWDGYDLVTSLSKKINGQ